jgi:wyosine [tRNA(Phe)-imidazoG37] synthetase (radical SAM superfamily)
MGGYRYLYGPVPSRRLGRSLGIDLVPHKVCTYDCIYCQIGKTTKKTMERKEYVPTQEVLKEIERFLSEETFPPNYLSLSGSGEPTLHSKIGTVIQSIKKLTSIPVAVLTNGSLLFMEEVRQDLRNADVVLPSLDAVTPEVFFKVNRPLCLLSIEKVIEGLIQFRKTYEGQIWLEILFCKGINDSEEEILRMREVVEQIEPDQIHLNTVVRPPSERWASPLNQEEMEKIRDLFGERATVISEFDRHPVLLDQEDSKEKILKILKRRPLSLTDLSRGMKIPKEELERTLQALIVERKIKKRCFESETYYEISEGP